jgi:hypothetical protein
MTQDTRAFELREDVDAELFGGSVTLADGTAFDVGAALEEGGGVIVTNDTHLIGALDLYPALKRAAVPPNATPLEADVDWNTKTVADLEAEIERRNADRDDDEKIEVAPPGNKPELVAAIAADDNESE